MISIRMKDSNHSIQKSLTNMIRGSTAFLGRRRKLSSVAGCQHQFHAADSAHPHTEG